MKPLWHGLCVLALGVACGNAGDGTTTRAVADGSLVAALEFHPGTDSVSVSFEDGNGVRCIVLREDAVVTFNGETMTGSRGQPADTARFPSMDTGGTGCAPPFFAIGVDTDTLRGSHTLELRDGTGVATMEFGDLLAPRTAELVEPINGEVRSDTTLQLRWSGATDVMLAPWVWLLSGPGEGPMGDYPDERTVIARLDDAATVSGTEVAVQVGPLPEDRPASGLLQVTFVYRVQVTRCQNWSCRNIARVKTTTPVTFPR